MPPSAPVVSTHRAPTPEDLYRFRIPTDVRLSPDGRLVAFVVQSVAPARDGYRHALWLVPSDASGPARPITLGVRHDTHPRFSPDARTLAFLSDRRLATGDAPDAAGAAAGPVDREDTIQVYLLPLDGGEARMLSDLPRGVSGFAWAPDSASLVALSASRGATREADARRRDVDAGPRGSRQQPRSDYHFVDRLQYLMNGEGFVYDKVPHLWLVDASTGEARRLTDGPSPDRDPAWSPDATKIAFSTNRRNDWDIDVRASIWTVDVASGALTGITDTGRSMFTTPAWLPDGATIACLGHRFPAGAGSRSDIWLFAADGSDGGPNGGRNLSAVHDLMPGSSMASDLVPLEEPRLVPSSDGAWLTFSAPVAGSFELWRISTADGTLQRLTSGRHHVSAFDQQTGPGGTGRLAWLRASATELPDVYAADLPKSPGGRAVRGVRLTQLNADALAGLDLVEPVERWTTVDGRPIQGWLMKAVGQSTGALVVEIHGGPQSLYGWSPLLEIQVLAGAGISVWYCNPRGSVGYGQDFAHANYRDWGPGPMRDVLAGLDGLLADGTADPGRLGVTGGSYGGYLTSWIIGHDERFAAAVTCRSVSDMVSLMLTGDLSGGDFGRLEFGTSPWDDPQFYREISPLTYAQAIRTPLLIQHAENDLRCTIAQAEELFSVLRTLRRPVRLMRVPSETHELTRSGTPFRRAENLVQVTQWFRHYLVLGRKGLPRLPRDRAGR